MNGEKDSSVRSLLLRGLDRTGDDAVRSWRQQDAPQQAAFVRKTGLLSGGACAPDFIGDTSAFKKLFSLALSRREYATVAIHRVGQTLVVDGGDDSAERCAVLPWPRSSRDNAVLQCEDAARLSRVQRALAGFECVKSGLEQLGVGERDEEEEWGVAESKAILPDLGIMHSATEVLESIVGETLAPSEREELSILRQPHSYARVIAWCCEELKLVSGSDVVILPGDKPATLRMAPADAVQDLETRRLALVDYYLENMLAAAPQLALCLERRGVVVGSRLVETSAIPSVLSDEPLFDAPNLEFHAAALLRFVAEHCATDGATYVLRQDRSKAEVKLFDVSTLCDPSQRRWKWLLATLSVRFAHRIASHLGVHLLEPERDRQLRRRRRLLLETAVELLTELDDLDDDAGTHFVLRASLEEQLASTYLPSNNSSTLNRCEISELENAARRLEAGLGLVQARLRRLKGDDDGQLASVALRSRAQELSEAVAQLALTLAERHLADHHASSLMHELRRAAERAGQCAKLRTEVWRIATAFATGIYSDRYAWSDKGAHASDAIALVTELSGQATDELAEARAAAAEAWLQAAEAGFGVESAEAGFARDHLGDACNDVGRSLLRRRAPTEAAISWLRRAAANLSGLDAATARLNLAVAMRQVGDATHFEAALHQCSLALDALSSRDADGLRRPETARLWDIAQIETGATELALGIARRKRHFGGSWAGPTVLTAPPLSIPAEPVLAPLERAVKIFDKFPGDDRTPAAHFQLGSFLSLLAKRDHTPVKQAQRLKLARHHLDVAKNTFPMKSPSRVLCAIELSDLLAGMNTDNDPKHALLAFFELLQPREAIAHLEDPHTPPALAALAVRLPLRAKALLFAAHMHRHSLRDEHVTIAACKHAYRLALDYSASTHAHLLATVDHLRAALAPLFVFQVPSPT